VLADLDLRIEPGERVLLAGPSGAGKSTLLRAIAGLLLTVDVGDLTGTVEIDGRAPQEAPGQVGLLLQDPAASVVASQVWRDVAFGLENIGVPRGEMPERAHHALEAAGFPYDGSRSTDTLSGGETQRLALAGALALQPRVLLLDEPTSMLDEENAEKVRQAVLRVCAETGLTLVVAEHRLGPWVQHMDRCIVLDMAGEVVADGPAARVLAENASSLLGQGIWVPGAAAPEPDGIDPVMVEPRATLPAGESLVRARDVVVRYRSPFGGRRREAAKAALEGAACDLLSGRTLSLTGPSGAGKSTFLAVLAGLQRPDSGSAEIHRGLAGRKGRGLADLTSKELAAQLAWVPQTPEHGMVRATALDELMVTALALGYPESAARARALALLDVLGLSGLADAQSHHLSGGEQRRLMVAAALVHGPNGLLLDEPTVGQDRRTWAAVVGACRSAAAAGAAVAVATHDLDATSALEADGQVLHLAGGRILGTAA
jgi:energy-coupling factor transport system ATP-binding protein